MSKRLRFAVVFALAMALLAAAYFLIGGFVSVVFTLAGLATFWIGLRYFVADKP